MITSCSSLESFKRCYLDIQQTCDLVEKMAGVDGKPQFLNDEQVHALKRLTRAAACSANAIAATHDGKRS